MTSWRQALAEESSGVLAPQSGGCARHVLSRRVRCQLWDNRFLAILFEEGYESDHGHRLLVQSTVTLTIESSDASGLTWHFTGHMQPHENGAWLLHVVRAYEEQPDGRKTSLLID